MPGNVTLISSVNKTEPKISFMVCKPVLDEGFVKTSQLGGGVGFVYATESPCPGFVPFMK